MIAIRTCKISGAVQRHPFDPELCHWLAKYICGDGDGIHAALLRGETVATNYATWKLETL